jgi:chromate transporter
MKDAGPLPLAPFVRASTLHVGAAAATTSLRHDLVDEGTLDASTFDEAFAVARLTPGTNYLAMYTLLGLRLDGWRGAATTLTIGTVFPAIIGVLIAAVFVRVATHPLTVHGMRGARAGALAVFVWASARLLRPQILKHRARGAVVAAAILVLLVVWSIPPVIALLLGTGIGAGLLRSES